MRNLLVKSLTHTRTILQSHRNQSIDLDTAEAVVRRCSIKKVFLKISQNSQEDTCARISFLIKLQAWELQLYKKETLAQVLSFEVYEVFNNTYFYRTPPVAVSDTAD